VVRQINVRELHAMLTANEPVHLLDVRQPWEHALAALPGSTLIPLPELGHRTHEVQTRRDELVVAYCHHGIRSLTAAACLARAGIANVVSLAGGIDAWSTEIDPGIPRY
jgi:rhodanese-related sulfurtransferase